MKTLIVSDLHLGSKASRAAAQFDTIARVAGGYDRVIFNGDTLDRCYVDPAGDEEATRFLEAVKSRCGGRDGEPVLLSGNHDPAATAEFFVYDEESKTLIFHGDSMADCTHPSKPEDREMREKLRERWAELGGRPTDFMTLHRHYREVQLKWLPIINPYKKSKTMWQYARSLLLPPRRPVDIVLYWHNAPGRALTLARGFSKPVKRVVFGHSHRAGAWTREGVELFNTGSFMPFSAPICVCLDGGVSQHVALSALAERMPKVFGSAGIAGASSDNRTVRVQKCEALADKEV